MLEVARENARKLGVNPSYLRMNVEIQRDIGRFVYGDWEKELYAESPLFEICARKE